MKTAAILALGGGSLLILAWLVGLAMMAGRGVPARGNILAATGISWIHLIGGIGCVLAFGWLWAQELSACATGAKEDLDLWVVLWSTVLALVGMGAVWMVLVRRVWCTTAGLVRRTWLGKIQQVPYGKLAGAAQFRFDDVILPCEEEKVVLDITQPDFWRVMDYLAKQGVDFSAIPPHLDQKLDKKRARYKNRT